MQKVKRIETVIAGLFVLCIGIVAAYFAWNNTFGDWFLRYVGGGCAALFALMGVAKSYEGVRGREFFDA